MFSSETCTPVHLLIDLLWLFFVPAIFSLFLFLGFSLFLFLWIFQCLSVCLSVPSSLCPCLSRVHSNNSSLSVSHSDPFVRCCWQILAETWRLWAALKLIIDQSLEKVPHLSYIILYCWEKACSFLLFSCWIWINHWFLHLNLRLLIWFSHIPPPGFGKPEIQGERSYWRLEGPTNDFPLVHLVYMILYYLRDTRCREPIPTTNRGSIVSPLNSDACDSSTSAHTHTCTHAPFVQHKYSTFMFFM